MNIALINASPKNTESASGSVLNDLKTLFPTGQNIKDFCINKPSLTEACIKDLRDCPVWIFAFPLYVDAVPSHLLSCLCQIEAEKIAGKDIHVYAIINCGFYEGTQTRNAMAIMENWCVKSGLIWGMGIGFGGGSALEGMETVPLGKGPKTNLGKACAVLADAAISQTVKENIYTSINFPKFFYKIAAEIGWNSWIKKNGGKKKDLNRRL